ncbi:hypothetical protein ACNKHR_08030 [Shigella flexneri]
MDNTSNVIDALRQRLPKIVGPRKDDVYYATTNRRSGARPGRTGGSCVGGRLKNSSNSNRLAELAQRLGKRAFLIDDAKDIQEESVKEVNAAA